MLHNFCYYILNPLVCAIFCTYFFSITLTPTHKQPYQVLWVLITQILAVCVGLPFYKMLLLKVLVISAVQLFSLMILFRDSFVTKVMMIFLSWFIVALVETFFGVILVGVFRIERVDYSASLAFILFLASFAILMGRIVGCVVKFACRSLNTRQIFYFSIGPMSQFSLFLLVTHMTLQVGIAVPSTIYVSFIICMAMTLWFNIVLVRLIDDVAEKNRLEVRSQAYLEQQKMQMQHYLALIEKQKMVRSMRHDIANHMQTIHVLLQRGEDAEASDYSEQLFSQYQNVTNIDYCDNKVVDAVLYNKLSYAKSLGITTTVTVTVAQAIDINELDLMCVFSNMLDNAIEACEKLERDANRFIHVSANSNAGFLTIKIENSAAMDASTDLISTKSGAIYHGIGLKNVATVIANYDGSIEYLCENGVFTVIAALRCNTPPTQLVPPKKATASINS